MIVDIADSQQHIGHACRDRFFFANVMRSVDP